MNKKAVIAMSGGVDSSVAALLTLERGFECIGATMKLFDNGDADARENSCCSLADVEDARSVATSLGIPYYVFNFTSRFQTDVIDRFVCAYEHGQTPNPCIDCNKYMKFDKLFQRARELDYDYIVTGHYAQIIQDTDTGRYLLKKAADLSKDQSYVLYSMTQEQLAHTLFPLGGMTKTEVRAVAEAHGFINAKKYDSQDICFVQNGRYADFIRQYTGKSYPEGSFVDKTGRVLGTHKGIINYTIGQRKGLGLALPAPMYVCSIDVENNTVVLGYDEDLYTTELEIGSVNFISVEKLDAPLRCTVKIRYRQDEQPATVIQTGSASALVSFDEPQRAITKGQAAVIYDGDTVIGGGIIQ